MNDYPFELWVYAVISDGGTDANGFEINPTSDWVKHSECYEQVLGQSSVMQKANGESFVPYSKIFLPADAQEIANGTKIQVRDSDFVRFTGECKRFSRDFEHCRLWA
ncbi:hypothetical protein AGMMS49525_04710 [Bacteroidia bacterium]|nr:hypothetical protein AGMMS49525_04710 [Bacteroidia bacterium]